MKRILAWPASALLMTAVWGASASPLHAQTPAATREDSLRALRSARSAQAAFERARRNNLPWTWGGGGGECDERIGRFCLTYDDGREDWVPPEEPPPVTRARERLLTALDDAATVIPGDDWVAGQRVRYHVEARGFEGAREAAVACRATAWWCDALLAYAEHHRGDDPAADVAIDGMLSRMPPDMRREWMRLDDILDRASLRHYRTLDDSARVRFENRFWSLADPFYGLPGNAVRSEHYVRNILDHLQDRAESTDDLSWGKDLREILIRFGWPSGWERIRPAARGSIGQPPSLISHFADARIDVLPPPELLVDPFEPDAGNWDDDDRRPRASYALLRRGERLRWFEPFDHQIALFRSGDSMEIIAAYDLPGDSLPAGAVVDAFLAVRTNADGVARVERRPTAGTHTVLAIRAPTTPALISLEILVEGAPWAARARIGRTANAAVPGVLAVSDLLLIDDPGGVSINSREEAMAHARGSLRAGAGERVAVYWEVYGLDPGRTGALEMSLRLVRTGGGWLRRVAERVGVVREVQPIRVGWAETANRDPVLRRTLALELPANLRPGAYDLELTIASTRGESLVVTKTLQVGP